MALCDILVCLDSTIAGERRLDLALNLAHADKAHLTAVYALPEPPRPTGPASSPHLPPTIRSPVSPDGARAIGGGQVAHDSLSAQEAREAERADGMAERFRADVSARGLASDWQMFNHGDLPELIDRINAVDLAVIGQFASEELGEGCWLRPDDIIVDAGRPVLIVPYAGQFERVGSRVLIAWDGTREASRALHEGLPLILAAEAATVLHVGEGALDGNRRSLARIVDHLARHGVQAKPEELPRGGIPVAEVILSRAGDMGADLIVMGAYHHSPLRESLLGGVSRALLDHMTVPVLMSH